MNNEDVVAWSLSRGLVSEASAESLYGVLRYVYVATAAASLIFASLALGTVRRAISAGGSHLRAASASMLRYLGRPTFAVARGGLVVLGYTGRGAQVAAGYVRSIIAALVNATGAVVGYVWLEIIRLGVSTTAVFLRLALSHVWRGSSIVLRHLWRGTSVIALAVGALMHYVRVGVASLFGMLWLGLSSLARILGLVLAVVRLWSYMVLRYMRLGVATTFGVMATVTRYGWWPISTFISYIRTGTILLGHGIGAVLRGIWLGASALGSHLGRGLSTIGGAARTVFHPLRLAASAIHHHLRLGVATVFLVVGWTLRYAWQCVLITLGGVGRVPSLSVRTAWIGISVVPDIWRAAAWKSRRRKGAFMMSDFNLTRERLLSLVVTVLVFFTIGAVSLRFLWPSPPEPTVTVVHWTTGHLTRDGLLKDMAKKFNEAGNRIGSGKKTVVEVYDAPSELQGKYLSELLRFGTRRDLNEETNGYVVKNIPDPTIVTPSSAHWLVTVNYEVKRDRPELPSPVVDLQSADSIVRPVIGIVTYEEMAKCMGWPEREIGYADIIALRNDPQGWARYDCAKAEWGKTPLLAFTDPTTSSTGRSLHLALYSFAANKSPEDLTIDDVNDREVVAYVKEFQGLIDHYLIGTTVLNTKIYQGPRYGHFFVMPEDNLIHLYEGTEKSYLNGIKTKAPPIKQRMVMIYPKEGSMPRKNCACIVQADWVSEEQVEASQQWIDFIRKDEQQRAFMAAGFRPGTDLDLNYPGSKISSKFGLNPAEPKVLLNPSLTRPDVAAAIDENWELVKRPAIVTFVVDTSGSMLGGKLRQAKDGLVRALGSMARNNQVGLITFDDTVNASIPVAPLVTNRFAIADAIHEMRARGETALYNAIRSGIQMTDAAEGDAGAIRAVVVLTDGQANKGSTELDDIIEIMSRGEVPIRQFGGMVDELWALDAGGTKVAKQDIIGTGQAMETDYPIQIFYIGIGEDADMEVGRLLAGATGAEFQGVTEQDLASLLEEFSKYF